MQTQADNSVGAIVCDPPYGVEFQGSDWDNLSAVKRALRGKTSGLPVGPGSGRGTSPTAGRPGFDLSLESQCQMQKWHVDWLLEAMRILVPQGHIRAFSSPRTFHRLAAAMEQAGFIEIRQEAWGYGSGMPKSLNVSKVMDRMADIEPIVVGTYNARGFSDTSPTKDGRNQWAAGAVSDKQSYRTAPASDNAKTWHGWGTGIKPAYEVILIATKPG